MDPLCQTRAIVVIGLSIHTEKAMPVEKMRSGLQCSDMDLSAGRANCKMNRAGVAICKCSREAVGGNIVGYGERGAEKTAIRYQDRGLTPLHASRNRFEAEVRPNGFRSR